MVFDTFLEYQSTIRRAQRLFEPSPQRTEISPCEYPSGISFIELHIIGPGGGGAHL